MADVLTIVDTGKKIFAENQVGKRAPENIVLGLFVNDVVISGTTVIGDLTMMSTHGIVQKTLAGSSWPAAAINGDGQAVTAYAAQDFLSTAADEGVVTQIYGYLAKVATGGELLWAVKFDTPKPITYENEKITIIPEMRFNQKA